MTDFASLIQLEALCSSARTCRLFVERKGDSDFTEASFLGYQPQELRNWSMDTTAAGTARQTPIHGCSVCEERSMRIRGQVQASGRV